MRQKLESQIQYIAEFPQRIAQQYDIPPHWIYSTSRANQKVNRVFIVRALHAPL